MRTSNPDIFLNAHLFVEVFGMLENYHFRFPARKFIHDVLFDKLQFDDKTWSVIDSYNTNGKSKESFLTLKH